MNEFIQHMMIFGVLGAVFITAVCVGVVWVLWLIGIFDIKDPR